MRHSKGPWIKALTLEEGCDLHGRRYAQGAVFNEDRDECGRRGTVIRGSALVEDWRLIEAAPAQLLALKRVISGIPTTLKSVALDYDIQEAARVVAKAEGRAE